MASLKEIKDRINSVNGIMKITSAMKLVASSKLRKAQNAIGNLLPYQRQIHHILADLLAGEAEAGELYITQRPLKKSRDSGVRLEHVIVRCIQFECGQAFFGSRGKIHEGRTRKKGHHGLRHRA